MRSSQSEAPVKYEWKPLMGEISGFGGTYEEGCRVMLIAALEWLDTNPDAKPEYKGYKDVYGICEETNKDAEAMSRAMMDAPYTDSDGTVTTIGAYGATGAMHQACVSAALFVKKHGWDEYVRQMSERKGTDDTQH